MEQHVKHLITVAAATGPTREMLDLLDIRLQQSGVTLHRQTRRYDALCWPHASAGFFKLKSKIPSLLKALDLSEGGKQALG